MLCFICHLPAASAFADKIEMQGYWCWGKANADGAVQVVSFMVVFNSALWMQMEMRLLANMEIIGKMSRDHCRVSQTKHRSPSKPYCKRAVVERHSGRRLESGIRNLKRVSLSVSKYLKRTTIPSGEIRLL
jgi:hypothetical protein